jgi:hypothetical protein
MKNYSPFCELLVVRLFGLFVDDIGLKREIGKKKKC